MSDNVASLGLEIRTYQLETAVQKLQSFQDASAKAEAGAGKLRDATDGLSGSTSALTSMVERLVIAYAAYKLENMAQTAILAAARFETLGVALDTVGKNIGYSQNQMNSFAQGVQAMGISMNESRESVLKMGQANLDLSKAQDLARVAQDAAVIANINSSDAFQNLIQGIVSGRTEILHNMGIMAEFEGSYRAFATQLGKTSADLTAQEKVQARMNVVLELGANIAGTYEAAMTTAGKQINSFTRYTQDLQVELGKAFGPALADMVEYFTIKIKAFTASIAEPGTQSTLASIGEGLAVLAKHSDTAKVAMAGLIATYAAFKIEAALTGASIGGITAALAANPWSFAVLGAAALVTVLYEINEAFSYNRIAMEQSFAQYKNGMQEVDNLTKKQKDAEAAFGTFSEAIIKAGSDEKAQTEALAALQNALPGVAGSYTTLAQGIDQASAGFKALNAQMQNNIILAQQIAFDKLKETAKQWDNLSTAIVHDMSSINAAAQADTTVGKWILDIPASLAKSDMASKATAIISAMTEVGAAIDKGTAAEKALGLASKDAILQAASDMVTYGGLTKSQSDAIIAVRNNLEGMGAVQKAVSDESKKQSDAELKAIADKKAAQAGYVNTLTDVEKEIAKNDKAAQNSTEGQLEHAKEMYAKLTTLASTFSQQQLEAMAQLDAAYQMGDDKQIKSAEANYDLQTKLAARAAADKAAYAVVVSNAQEKADVEAYNRAVELNNQAIADAKKALDEKVRIISAETSAVESKYKSGQIGENQMIAFYQKEADALGELAAKYPAASVEYSNLTKKKEEDINKIVQLQDKAATRELEIQKIIISGQQEGMTKTLELYDAEAKAHAAKEEVKLTAERASLVEEITWILGDRPAAEAAAAAIIQSIRNNLYAGIALGRAKQYDAEGQYTKDWLDRELAVADTLTTSDWNRYLYKLDLDSKYVDQQNTNLKKQQDNLDKHIELEKTQLQTNKENWDSMWTGIGNGTKVALDDILAHQKSWGTLAYKAFKDTYSSMVDYLQTSFVDIVNGDWGNLKKDWEDFCDAVLKAWMKMLAEMVAQWAMSGLASLLNSTFNLGINVTGNSAPGSTALGTLSTGASLASLVSKIPGIGSLFGPAAGAAPAGVSVPAITGGLGPGAMTQAEIDFLAAATGGAPPAAAATGGGAAAAGAAGIGMGAVAGGVGAFIAVGGMIASMLNAQQNTSPEEARANISDSINEINRLSEVMRVNKDTAGLFDDDIMGLSDTMYKMASRAGLTKQQIDLLAKGTIHLSQEMEDAAAIGDDQLVASLQAQLDELKAIGKQYGMVTTGVADYAQGLVEGGSKLAGVTAYMNNASQTMRSYTEDVWGMTTGMSDLAQSMEGYADTLGLSSEQTTALKGWIEELFSEFRDGELTVQELSDKLQTTFVEALAGTLSPIQSLIDGLNAIPTEIPITISYGVGDMPTLDPTKPYVTQSPVVGTSDLVSYGHTGGEVNAWGIGNNPVLRFHAGGEVPSLLLTGEGVLNRRAMSRLGSDGLNALNSGGSLGGDTIINLSITTPDNKPLEKQVLRLKRGPRPQNMRLNLNRRAGMMPMGMPR